MLKQDLEPHQDQHNAAKQLRTGFILRPEYVSYLNARAGQAKGRGPDLSLIHILLADLVVSSMRLLQSIDAEQPAILRDAGNSDTLMKAVVTYPDTLAFARSLVEAVILQRDRKQGVRYGEELQRAKDYIRRHFADNDLSLNTCLLYTSTRPTGMPESAAVVGLPPTAYRFRPRRRLPSSQTSSAPATAHSSTACGKMPIRPNSRSMNS